LYVSYIFDALAKVITGEDSDGGFWNESVQEMLAYFYNHFKSDSVEDAPIGGSLFTRAHLKNANAGLSFVKLPWVEPWFNMDGDTFSEVRGHDSVNDILRNRHKMQYTHTQDQMEIDGQGAYDEYGYTKYYLYPDITGDDTVTA
ncbi:MAG: hypothetical protein LUC37_01830, partial [Prevotella sp.]|nr:hypothetical protein [Prevotella sp.]